MKEFYYQIKGKSDDGYWSWPPLESGRIDAKNSKEARKLVEEEFGQKLPGRELKDKSVPFLLTVIDMADKPYLRNRFLEKNCKQCGEIFTDNEKYLVRAGGHSEYCSADCMNAHNLAQGIDRNVHFDFNGVHEAVVYKITNKITQKVYIGKTTQAYTLRWYQHFFQSAGTKFHDAIKSFKTTDWQFEVVEVIEIPSGLYGIEKHRAILAREQYWINYYDSINNGYNTATSLKEKSEEPELF